MLCYFVSPFMADRILFIAANCSKSGEKHRNVHRSACLGPSQSDCTLHRLAKVCNNYHLIYKSRHTANTLQSIRVCANYYNSSTPTNNGTHMCELLSFVSDNLLQVAHNPALETFPYFVPNMCVIVPTRNFCLFGIRDGDVIGMSVKLQLVDGSKLRVHCQHFGSVL